MDCKSVVRLTQYSKVLVLRKVTSMKGTRLLTIYCYPSTNIVVTLRILSFCLNPQY